MGKTEKFQEDFYDDFKEYDEQYAEQIQQEYKSLKQDYEKVLAKYEEKSREELKIGKETQKLGREMQKIEVEKMEGLVNEGYDTVVRDKLNEVSTHSKEHAKKFEDELKEIKRDEKKAIRRYQESRDENETYVPPDTSISDRKKYLYREMDMAIDRTT